MGSANILGERHEVGGEVYLSNDAGKTWKLLFKDPAFDRVGGLGIFDAKTLVRTWPSKGIERSVDAGATWANHRQSSPSWAPWHATDIQINPFYMGDYDVTASDFTNSTRGFVGAFQFMNTGGGGSGNSNNSGGSDNSIPVPNPDVFAVRLK